MFTYRFTAESMLKRPSIALVAARLDSCQPHAWNTGGKGVSES